MEFGRRRKRKTTLGGSRSRARPGAGAGAGRAMIALLMVAAIVYLVSASTVGTWLAEKVMAPAFEALSAYTGKKEPAEEAPSGAADVQQVSLSTDKSSVSANIALPALDCYALQMGVFSSAENADKQAQTIKAQGAGGYVLRDGDRYRVLAAGYAVEAEAKEVKDRLVNEGMDCTVHQISAPGATFRVSGQQSQLDGVEAGFSALREAQAALTDAAIAFDRDNQSVSQGQSAAQSIRSGLEEDMAGLAAYTDSAPAIARLVACQALFSGELATLGQSTASTHTAFSSELKYVQLSLTKAYADLVADLVG